MATQALAANGKASAFPSMCRIVLARPGHENISKFDRSIGAKVYIKSLFIRHSP